MFLKDGGKIIELRIADKIQDDCMKSVGCKAGIFPDKVIVKRRNENDETETIEYVPVKNGE